MDSGSLKHEAGSRQRHSSRNEHFLNFSFTFFDITSILSKTRRFRCLIMVGNYTVELCSNVLRTLQQTINLALLQSEQLTALVDLLEDIVWQVDQNERRATTKLSHLAS